MAQISTMMLKSKNRDCANKIRYGSPKLRKVLREVRKSIFTRYFTFRNFQTRMNMRRFIFFL